MPTDIVWAGRHGTIVIRRRRPDGTIVLLACDELDRDAEPTGTILQPEEEDEEREKQEQEKHKGGGVFPLAEVQTVSDRPLALDVSGLPAGILRFHTGTFARRAVEALEAGQHEVELDFAQAEQWGFRGETMRR
jgi:hypothetical protein